MGQLSERDRILKAKIDLSQQRPFFAYILMNMGIEQSDPKDDLPTMGVNQYGDLFWNESFVKILSDDELKTVLCHEAMHVATLTFQREGTRDHGLWNISTDLVINSILIKESFKFPANCVVPDRGDDFTFKSGTSGKNIVIKDVCHKTAEEVYDIISNNAKQIKIAMQCDGDGNYKGSIDKHLPSDKNSKGESTGKEKHEADVKANEEKWKAKATEAATAAKMRGSLSADIERLLGDLINPQIDWRTKLCQFLTKDIPVDFTMKLPGRRFYSTGVYYPSVIRERLEIVVGIDISGSIGGEEYNKFISEAVGIASSFPQIDMRMIWWSDHVNPKDDIQVTAQTKDMLATYKPHGGGGTTMSCFGDYLKKKGYTSRIFVILTDGYIEDKPKLPDGNVLFVLSKQSQDDIVKKYGEVCKLRI